MGDFKSVRHKSSYCPCCDHRLDASFEAKGQNIDPKPGDLSICIYCLAILEYQKDLTFKELLEEDLKKMDLETLAHLKSALYHAYHNKPPIS